VFWAAAHIVTKTSTDLSNALEVIRPIRVSEGLVLPIIGQRTAAGQEDCRSTSTTAQLLFEVYPALF
jgi:hypothetical protein